MYTCSVCTHAFVMHATFHTYICRKVSRVSVGHLCQTPGNPNTCKHAANDRILSPHIDDQVRVKWIQGGSLIATLKLGAENPESLVGWLKKLHSGSCRSD